MLLLQLLLSISQLPFVLLLVLPRSLPMLICAVKRVKEEGGKEASLTRKKYGDKREEGEEGGPRRMLVHAISSLAASLAQGQEEGEDEEDVKSLMNMRERKKRIVEAFVGKDCAACVFCRWGKERLVLGLVSVSAASLFSEQAAHSHAGICIDEKMVWRKKEEVEEAMLRGQLVVEVMTLLRVVVLGTLLPPSPSPPRDHVGRCSDHVRGDVGA